MLNEIETYRDLLNALLAMNDAHLDRRVQIVPAGECLDGDEPVELQPVIAIGTVDGMGFKYCRSSVDNRRHGDEVVLLTDWNPHREDGATMFELNPDGEDELDDIPIYPTGHDDEADWTGAAQAIIKRRAGKPERNE